MDARKTALEDVSAASLVRHQQNYASPMEKNVVPKFTHRLSLTMYKICKYKGFLRAECFRISTKSKDIFEKICIRENLDICMFYPVGRISLISPETYTSLNKNNRHYIENN